jgi:hypothetical protein
LAGSVTRRSAIHYACHLIFSDELIFSEAPLQKLNSIFLKTDAAVKKNTAILKKQQEILIVLVIYPSFEP